MLSFRRQRTQRERERRTRHALEDAKRLDDNANKTMTTLINRRRERRASNERCASTPKKGVTVTRQSRRESHRRRHDDDDVTMIATIAIGTAMGAELDADRVAMGEHGKRRDDDIASSATSVDAT